MRARVVLPHGVTLPDGHLSPHATTTVGDLLERLKLAKGHLTVRDRALMDEARDAIFELARGKQEAELALAARGMAEAQRRRSTTATLEPLHATAAAHLDVTLPTASDFTQPSVINHDIELDDDLHARQKGTPD